MAEASPQKITLTQRAEWVAALRSGNYTQGRSALCRVANVSFDWNGIKKTEVIDPEFCCLGVYADLFGQKGGETYGETRFEWGAWGGSIDLPAFIMSRQAQTLLMNLNDSGEYTFGQIADIIECLPIDFLRNGSAEDECDNV